MTVLESIQSVLIPFLAAIFLSAIEQNVLLTRALDPSRILDTAKERSSNFVWESLLLTMVLFFSAMVTYPVGRLIRNWEMRYPFVPLIYLVCVILVYFAIRLVVYKLFPKRTLHFDEVFTASTFNCAVLGSIIVMIQQGGSLPTNLGYAVGTGLGYLLACVLVWEGVRRLRLCDIPKPFQGLPIMLIYIGILSLSIYGITRIASK